MIRARLLQFQRARSGAAAVEFALVSLIVIATVIGIIDMGRLAFELNSAKAASRAAARFAVVSPAASTAINASWTSTLGNGAKAPNFSVRCNSSSCTCTSGSCPTGALNSTAFNNIVAAAAAYHPRVVAANVEVDYVHVGIGVVGNPYAPDVEPLVTVRLSGLDFASGALQVFGLAPFALPVMSTTLSGEDLN